MIKDNYLLEDMHAVSDEMLKLQEAACEALNIAAGAEFQNKQLLMDKINQSMKKLQRYNKKKLKNDELMLLRQGGH